MCIVIASCVCVCVCVCVWCTGSSPKWGRYIVSVPCKQDISEVDAITHTKLHIQQIIITAAVLLSDSICFNFKPS